MCGHGDEIHRCPADVERYAGEAVSGIRVKENALFAAESPDRVNILDGADLLVGVLD